MNIVNNKSCAKQYNYDTFEDLDFPLKVAETKGVCETSWTLHYHEYIEICLIKQGTGTYKIDAVDFPFEAGDIFIIGSNDIHLAYNDHDAVFFVLLLKPSLLWNNSNSMFEMDFLQVFMEIKKRSHNKIDKSNPYYQELVNILLEIQKENEKKITAYKLMSKVLILKFHAILARFFNVDQNSIDHEKIKAYAYLQPVLNYINSNFDQKIKLEDLSSMLNMGVSSFCNMFKNTIGTSPIEYVIKVRITKASQMLLETNMRIIDIANECGFNSLPHFIGCFKRFTGKIPKDFRNHKKYIK